MQSAPTTHDTLRGGEIAGRRECLGSVVGRRRVHVPHQSGAVRCCSSRGGVQAANRGDCGSFVGLHSAQTSPRAPHEELHRGVGLAGHRQCVRKVGASSQAGTLREAQVETYGGTKCVKVCCSSFPALDQHRQIVPSAYKAGRKPHSALSPSAKKRAICGPTNRPSLCRPTLLQIRKRWVSVNGNDGLTLRPRSFAAKLSTHAMLRFIQHPSSHSLSLTPPAGALLPPPLPFCSDPVPAAIVGCGCSRA